MKKTFKVEIHLKGAILDKVIKLNRTARKLNVSEVEVNFDEPYSVEEFDSDKGEKVTKVYTDLTVSHDQPLQVVGNWVLIAAIEKMGDSNLIKMLGDNDIDLSSFYYNDLKWCDHCKSSRNRRYAYILQDPDTCEHILVGKKCLADFIGHDVTDAINRAMFSYEILSMDEDFFQGGSGPEYYQVEYVATVAAKVLRNQEWVYDKEVFGSIMFCQLSPTSNTPKIKTEDADIELAKECVAEWLSWTDDVSCFQHNLNAIARCGAIEVDKVSWISGAVYGHLCRKRHRDGKERSGEKAYFGEVGKRDEFDLEFTGWSTFDSQYGTTYILRGFQTSTNNPFVWFASNAAKFFNDKDELIERAIVKATIKDHDEHNKFGIQTILTRVALVEVL